MGENLVIFGGEDGKGIFNGGKYGVVQFDRQKFTKKAKLLIGRYFAHACGSLDGAVITGGRYSL